MKFLKLYLRSESLELQMWLSSNLSYPCWERNEKMKTEVHKFISSANEAVRIMTKHEMMAEVACIVLAHTPQGRCFTGNKGTSKGEILKCGRRKVNSSLLIGEPKAFSLPLSFSLFVTLFLFLSLRRYYDNSRSGYPIFESVQVGCVLGGGLIGREYHGWKSANE